MDTERGTDFYAKDVPERKIHPEAFDFDALYTRSLADVSEAVKALDPATYSVVVIAPALRADVANACSPHAVTSAVVASNAGGAVGPHLFDH